VWEPLPGFNQYCWPVLSRVIKLSLKEKREMQKNQNRSRHMGMPTYTQTDTHTHTRITLLNAKKKAPAQLIFPVQGPDCFYLF